MQPFSRCLISLSDAKVLQFNARSRQNSHRITGQRHQPPGSYLHQLTQAANTLIAHSVAPSTRDKYNSHLQTYNKFCQDTDTTPFPTNQQTLIVFATFLHKANTSHQSINQHLAAVKYYTQVHGFDLDIPSFSRLYRLLRGIKRSQGTTYKKPPRIPITPPLLTTLGRNLWNSSILFNNKVMLWAAMLTAFYGFLRVSEYTSTHVKSYDPLITLCFHDVTVISPHIINIRIKASKTDPFRLGVNIKLVRNNSHLCPFNALVYFLNHHPTRQGPLFTWQDGRYLTRSHLASVLSKIKPPHLTSMSSHSFRIGAASTAAAAGLPRWLIQSLGRWTSNCYRDYIRIPQDTLVKVSHSLSTQHQNQCTPFDPDNV